MKTSLQHARLLYRDMLTSLSKFRELRDELEVYVERARRQAAKDGRVPPGPALEALADQLADRDPVAQTILETSNRHRDDSMAYALAYMVEVDYDWRTGPFTGGPNGDVYNELRGER